MMPLVSIITPTRNRNDILLDAVGSFTNTYDRVEWVVVDSSDKPMETLMLVQAMKGGFENVIYIYRPQAKWEVKCIIGVCRNLGVDAANGDYLTFADADDRQLPDKIKKSVTFLEMHDEYDAVFGNTQNETKRIRPNANH